MRTGVGLCAGGFACLALGTGGPCADETFFIGLLATIVGWLVSFVSLGLALTRDPRELVAPAAIAPFLTTGVILLGNGHAWNVIEPESWVQVAVFFLVAWTSAGVLVNRWRKGVAR